MIPNATMIYTARDAQTYRELHAAAKTPEDKLRLQKLEVAMGVTSQPRPPLPQSNDTSQRDFAQPTPRTHATQEELEAWLAQGA